MRWFISLERKTKNRLNDTTTKNRLKSLAGYIDEMEQLGFRAKPCRLTEPSRIFEEGECKYLYVAQIQVSRSGNTVDGECLDHLMNEVEKKASQLQWNVSGVKSDKKLAVRSSKSSRPDFEIPELNDQARRKYFGGIYEREPHIRLIHDSVQTYVSSSRSSRSHVLLYGLPGACKTTLFEAFKSFYEQDGTPRVVFIDGPTMSKAGLENWLLENADSEGLPDVLCIEEIEKQNLDNLLTLLSMMASGYIMKTNARVGRLSRLAETMVWATCNDPSKLRNFRQGAIWSRFTQRLYCPRPSRDIMHKILLREVSKRDGNPLWADAAMTFAYDTYPGKTGNRPLTDPREVIGLLDGGERLLDGSYQSDKLEILELERQELAEQETEQWGKIHVN